VTAPPRSGSRGRAAELPVAEHAGGRGLRLLRPERLRSPESIAAVQALEPELLVLADYGQIVPQALLDAPRHGALNLHPSLLPRHRGATPIPATIMAGDAQTGITLMRMDAGLDTGPVIAQWTIPLNGGETAPQLEDALANQAARLLEATLERWLAGEVEPVPQDESQATLTRVLRRSDGQLNPQRSARDLERQVRAYQPWPGSFLETEAGRLVVWRAGVGPPGDGREVGSLTHGESAPLALVTRDALLELHEVQPAGGRRMTSAELVRGRPSWHGARVAPAAESGS
jgi:methionyl-tRNA formyltransferase